MQRLPLELATALTVAPVNRHQMLKACPATSDQPMTCMITNWHCRVSAAQAESIQHPGRFQAALKRLKVLRIFN